MSLDAITAMPAAEWAADDCALFLWGVNSMLPRALVVIEARGFAYKTVAFTWAKRTARDSGRHFGLGYWTAEHGIVLAGDPRPSEACVASGT